MDVIVPCRANGTNISGNSTPAGVSCEGKRDKSPAAHSRTDGKANSLVRLPSRAHTSARTSSAATERVFVARIKLHPLRSRQRVHARASIHPRDSTRIVISTVGDLCSLVARRQIHATGYQVKPQQAV
jgi:hypothetical protein